MRRGLDPVVSCSTPHSMAGSWSCRTRPTAMCSKPTSRASGRNAGWFSGRGTGPSTSIPMASVLRCSRLRRARHRTSKTESCSSSISSTSFVASRPLNNRGDELALKHGQIERTFNRFLSVPQVGRSDQPIAQRLHDCLGFGVNLQLLVNAAEVKADGVNGDAEFGGGGLVVMSFDEQPKQSYFMRRQLTVRVVGRTKRPEESDHAARNLRRHRRTTGHGLTQRLEQARRRRLLQQIPRRSRAPRLEDAIVIVVDRQHQDEQIGMPLLEDANAVDAAHAGKTDVVEDDVREIAVDPVERFLHRTEGARTAKAWRAVDDRGEAVADFPAVFHNRHTNRLLALRAHRCPRSLGRNVAMSNAGPSYRSTWRPALAGPREEVRLKADATHVARRSA